jgi:hypothetical protein
LRAIKAKTWLFYRCCRISVLGKIGFAAIWLCQLDMDMLSAVIYKYCGCRRSLLLPQRADPQCRKISGMGAMCEYGSMWGN